ncbi:MAG TPA: winged helix DNA-binding protein, partial [Sediminibacterium sp.]|nr:winged helix DNA-binding protein [Sediminibacterium sp.]
ILAKMDRQGMIRRTKDKEDGRKVFISLTNAGKKMVEQSRYERDEWLRAIIEQTLSDRDKERLARLLPVLIRLGEAI